MLRHHMRYYNLEWYGIDKQIKTNRINSGKKLNIE